jgi:hypothetical protein
MTRSRDTMEGWKNGRMADADTPTRRNADTPASQVRPELWRAARWLIHWVPPLLRWLARCVVPLFRHRGYALHI